MPFKFEHSYTKTDGTHFSSGSEFRDLFFRAARGSQFNAHAATDFTESGSALKKGKKKGRDQRVGGGRGVRGGRGQVFHGSFYYPEREKEKAASCENSVARMPP